MKTKEQLTKEMHDLAKDYSQNAVKPYIAILQPRRDFRESPAQILDSHINRMIDCTAMSVSFHAIDGNPVDVADNYLIEKALEDNVKYAMFIEEDTVVPFYAIPNLVAVAETHPNSIIVGVYYVKFGGPMMGKIDEEGRWMHLDVTPNTGLREDISFCGLGCALIPMNIIKTIKEKFPGIPLFCMVPDKCWNDENVKAMGQDTWFYNLVNKCGFKVICDTSVQCLHMELATGKYTAHPDVNLDDYFTIIPITTKLQLADRKRVESDYISRTNIPDYINGIAYPITSLPIKYSEETVNKVISCLRDVQCTQNFYEVSMLCEEIKLLKPKTILEIGVDRGGSMNLWLNFSDPDTSYIGIDNNLQYLMDREHNQSKTFLECDSTDIKTLEQVKEILAGREIDFLFIDGDHKYETVKSDYNMYSPLVRKGGIIALHDIDVSLTNDHEEWVKGIKKFWKELKNTDIKYEEFINTDVDVHFGIGVIFK